MMKIQEYYQEQIHGMILKKIINDLEYYLSKIIGEKKLKKNSSHSLKSKKS